MTSGFAICRAASRVLSPPRHSLTTVRGENAVAQLRQGHDTNGDLIGQLMSGRSCSRAMKTEVSRIACTYRVGLQLISRIAECPI
jgi:hypothetical protein